MSLSILYGFPKTQLIPFLRIYIPLKLKPLPSLLLLSRNPPSPFTFSSNSHRLSNLGVKIFNLHRSKSSLESSVLGIILGRKQSLEKNNHCLVRSREGAEVFLEQAMAGEDGSC
ncbi:hypothetical protein VIGAN_02284900 [Vigna angularis var. angularis]|uniref:Uncharacterized protein n=1 Tax=Vigna angularis var. angularis TaxID=157739 RepID=A0A0S3RGZ1_PHAAN|nr:hypothetical protein VIGAN_02284900 [Vigna angularis var. angularis]